MSTRVKTKSTKMAWIMVIFAMFDMLYYQGLLSNTLSLFLVPITEDLGISRTLYSGATSVTGISNAIFSAFFVVFLNKLGQKKMFVIGASLSAVELFMMYLAGCFPQIGIVIIYVSKIIRALVTSWATMMVVNIICSTWAKKNNGLLMGIATAMGGLGGTIFSPLVQSWINAIGWKNVYLCWAIMSVVVAIFAAFVVKFKPGPKDALLFDDGKEVVQAKDEDEAAELPGMTLLEARKTRNFYFGVAYTFLSGILIYPPITIIAAYATDLGLVDNAASAVSLIYSINMVLTFFIGGIIDKFKCRPVMLIMVVLIFASDVLLSMEHISATMLYVIAALLGVGYTVLQVPLGCMVREKFGAKEFGKIQSFFYTGMVAGMAIGNPLINVGFDLTGTYRSTFMIYAAGLVLMAIFLFLATGKIKYIKK